MGYICFLHKESQIVMTKGIPGSYRLYLTVFVGAKLYDFNIMGTREVLFVFLIFMFGTLLLGSFVLPRQCVLRADIEPVL